MKVYELLDGIRKRDLVLPEFQREYVWTRDQSKQLMVSLLKGYPVGGLLFWKTDDPPELKNLKHAPEKLGTIEVILDGQQRLTTLYLLLKGEIPHYYIEQEISNDPRELYFNIDNCDLQYYQATRMRGNPLWHPVITCFDNDEINIFGIATEQADNDGERLALANRYNKNLNRLHQIRDMDIPVQTVPSHASIDEAIDIFDRVNSQGTKLTDAELALTHVTGKWPQARREMKAKIDELSKKNFYFDLTFMTRALTGVVTNRALFEQIHQQPRDALLDGWKKLTKILDYLVSLLPAKAYIHSTEDINTTNIFVPWIVFLARNELRFPDEHTLKHALHWLYAANMWARYTGQTDQRLEHDVSLIVRHENPWPELCNQIVDQRGRIEVKGNDFEGRGVQHPLYRMAFVVAKANGAIDWFNGAPLGTTYGSSYRIHNHHIFPSSYLYANGWDSDNHLHRKIVNEIANRAFLTADTNMALSNTPPADYLPDVKEKYPGALVNQFIPIKPDLWCPENYSNFLEERRKMLARKINEFMDVLVAEPVAVRERPIGELVSLGESATLEFKSTLQWDMVRGQTNKYLRFSSLKTIAAFLNSEGGTLVIGVEDDGTVCGLDRDLKQVKNHSLDGFEQLLVSLVHAHIGPEVARLIDIRYEAINGHHICAVDVDKSTEPVFLSSPRGTEFYIRIGNTSRPLDAEETHRYIQMNQI